MATFATCSISETRASMQFIMARRCQKFVGSLFARSVPRIASASSRSGDSPAPRPAPDALAVRHLLLPPHRLRSSALVLHGQGTHCLKRRTHVAYDATSTMIRRPSLIYVEQGLVIPQNVDAAERSAESIPQDLTDLTEVVQHGSQVMQLVRSADQINRSVGAIAQLVKIVLLACSPRRLRILERI
jgi:hypothetical protein